MARATGTPIPVMAETSDENATTTGTTAAKGAAAGKAGSMGAAVGSETHKTAAASTTPAGTGTGARDNVYLGGPWGASFIGKTPAGKDVKGLTWPRRHTVR